MTILDSGDRTEYSSGAVRDMRKGKGRCDLIPLDVVGKLLSNKIIKDIYKFTKEKDLHYLYDVLTLFAEGHFSKDEYLTDEENIANMILEVSIHFEEGARKYGENNWQKGLPVSGYIDSAIRHYLKALRGDKDENHERAFVWNILCCIWTIKHHKEPNAKASEVDIEVIEKEKECPLSCTKTDKDVCCFNCDKYLSCMKEEIVCTDIIEGTIKNPSECNRNI